MAKKRRTIRQIERRYIVEYVMQKFPDRVAVRFNAPIGLPPEELLKRYPGEDPRAFQKWRSYADAIVILRDRIVLIEAKIHDLRRGVGDLLDYAAIFWDTPEMAAYRDKRLELLLVIPVPDYRTLESAKRHKVAVDIYCPSWVEEYRKERGLAI